MNYKKNIFSILILLFSLLLLFYILYKSEIYWSGEKRSYYFKFYIFSLVSIIFSILTFYINQKIKKYLIIIVISFFSSLYLFEYYLIYLQNKDKAKIEAKVPKKTKFKFYQELKKINDDIVVTISPRNYKYESSSIFSLSGISDAKTINCNESGYYSIYNSDRYGFNNPDKEWESKEIEYLLVGDSFTHGDCVNRPNDIGSNLRILSNKSVLNLGYGGNGPLKEFATLREYLNPNVQKVIWIYYEGNDLVNLSNELTDKILISYFDNPNFSQNLILKQDQINNLAIKEIKKEFNQEKQGISLKNKLKSFFKLYGVRTSLNLNNQTPKKEFKKIIKLAKELTNRNNSKFYFVYLPEYNRYKYSKQNKNYGFIKKTVQKLGIPFIDIDNEVFKKERNPLNLFPFELYGHYTPDGYKKVSKAIYKLTKK